LIQTTVQYLRKKAPQLLQKSSNYKPIVNIETINILLTILQLALPSLTNPDLIQEIQTMISNGKIQNNFNPFPSSSTTNGLSQLRSLQSNSFSIVALFFFTFCKTSFIVEDVYIERKKKKTHTPYIID
jgi:hypothetical protein